MFLAAAFVAVCFHFIYSVPNQLIYLTFLHYSKNAYLTFFKISSVTVDTNNQHSVTNLLDMFSSHRLLIVTMISSYLNDQIKLMYAQDIIKSIQMQ